MARLSLSLLGPFQVTLAGQPVTGFESDKVRALLAYLAVEADRPHRRETLAGLLWPDWPERAARGNLRHALANLRKAIGDRQARPPFLLITRETVQFNRASDYRLDATAFTALVETDRAGEAAIRDLEEAVDLYRGSFLEGFSLKDSPAFEEWSLLTRERLQRQALTALRRLAGYYQGRGEHEQALDYAWPQVELEPWQEEAHRQLMRLLALSGQRSAALAQYETCRRLLAEELGVEPAPETTALVERIRAGEIRPGVAARAARTIRGYELRERIGAGNFGEVYRAYQPQVGRDVAIKIILPQYANQPDFIRRFESEAHLVARLEHPHIVPLYDYWREPDGAYLVMRWLRAGSLQAALQRSPWKVEAAVGLVDQITAALAAAHQQGVVHRDIKPANILLDEEGNAYLSDFGIAKELSAAVDLTEPGVVTGSPAYISPEQVDGQPATPLADIYSLGIVLYELLTGEHPFPDESLATLLVKHLNEPLPPLQRLRPDLPAAVDEIIQRATAKDPAQRYPDALALAAAFREALTAEPGPVRPVAGLPRPEPANPYKGLRPFQEADAADFFGREALAEQLVARLAEAEEPAGFLAVVGPSGSGKSSLVRAGLIPALRRGALPGSENWFVVQMLPGPHPLEELEAALLRIAVNPPESLLRQMSEDERGLLRAIKRCLPAAESELLLVIDQFEEVFTLVEDETERAHFLASLLAAVSDPRSRLRLVVTLRADFYDRPLLYPEVGDLLRRRAEVVLPLSPAELERAIAGPAGRVGLRPEPGLVAAIVGDVSRQPGALPLLQYALTELFERREGNALTLAAYQATGGVAGALARRAEELYAGLDAAGQAAVRQLFLRLVTLGEGTEDTRRRVLRAELEAVTIEATADHRPPTAEDSGPEPSAVGGQRSAVMDNVIDAFGRYRLLTFDHDPATRGPTVEIAHEALLREWPRLRAWIDASREDLRLHRRLTAAATEWMAADKEAGFLLRGARLDQFESWAATTDLALTRLERAYLEASLAGRQARQAAEAARQAREAALERRAVNRLRALVAVLAAATVIAIGLTVFAFNQTRQAQRQARIAVARELAAAAVSNLDVDPERSILLALQAVETTYPVDGTVLREAEEALRQAVQASRVQFTVSPADGVAFSPDGTVLATAGPDDKARLWDAATGEELLTLSGHADRVRRIAFSPDGARVVTTSLDRTAKVWDAATGEELLTLSGHTEGLLTPAWSPDGSRIVTTSFDGTARVWEAASGRELLVLPHSGTPSGPDFSPDGRRVAIADDAAVVVRVWDVFTGEEVLTLTGHSAGVSEAAFSPDGTRLATAGSDLTAKVWDAETGEELLTLEGHTGWVFAVDFSPDGALLATGGQDGTAKVWDAASGRELLTLAGHAAGIGKIFFSPDGARVVTGSDDGTAKVWNVTPEGSREWLTLAGHTDLVFSAAFSPDGTRIATASWDGTAKVWDAASGEELLVMTGHTDQVFRIAFSPDGERLATASRDETVKVWDAETGEELLTLTPETGWVYGLAFSPDGARLATGGADGTAKVWDAATGQELLTLPGHTNFVFRVAFSPDGARLATASWDGTAKLWDAATGREALALVAHEGVNNVAFSPDGARLATAGMDGTAKVWDAASGDELLTLAGHNAIVWDVAFSPDGTQLATAGFDGVSKLWDAATGQELLTLTGHPQGSPDLAFSPDGTRLATTGETVRVHVLPIEELAALARARVTRPLTDEECRQYLHLAEEQCPPTP